MRGLRKTRLSATGNWRPLASKWHDFREADNQLNRFVVLTGLHFLVRCSGNANSDHIHAARGSKGSILAMASAALRCAINTS